MNIPHRKSPSEKQAFSLIELLIVITIIGILTAILIPVGGQVQKQMRKVSAQKDCGELKTALSSYYTEYKKFPQVTTREEPIPTSGDNALIATLIAATGDSNAEKFNPRGVLFLSGKPAKLRDTYGLYTDGPIQFNDPWSLPREPQPYWVVFDLNYDNKVEAPRLKGTGNREIYSTVAVWSNGPDRDEGGDDNVGAY